MLLKCREALWQPRTDPSVVLLLRLINTLSLHYGSVVAVYCLALCWLQMCSGPFRHHRGEIQLHRLCQKATLVQDCAADIAASESCDVESTISALHPQSSSSYKTEAAAVDQHSSLVSVCPPKSLTLPASTGSRAFTEVNVSMSETDWYCSAV